MLNWLVRTVLPVRRCAPLGRPTLRRFSYLLVPRGVGHPYMLRPPLARWKLRTGPVVCTCPQLRLERGSALR